MNPGLSGGIKNAGAIAVCCGDHMLHIIATLGLPHRRSWMALPGITRKWLLAGGVALGLFSFSLRAANLKPATAAAFDRYIKSAEVQADKDLHGDSFLFIDRLPDADRHEAYRELQQGKIRIRAVRPGEYGQPNSIPDGLIHDWVGIVFVPHATLSQTLAVLQNYNNYSTIYKPAIQKSVLVEHSGNDYKTTMTLYNKSIITVVLHADFDVSFDGAGDSRALSRSYSMRIAEVQNPGQPNEHELPVGTDRGYVWRLYSYWRIEQKDGGVYIQTEVIELSRAVPSIYAFLVRPLTVSIPKTYLASTLAATRNAIVPAHNLPNKSLAATPPPAFPDQTGPESTASTRESSPDFDF